MSNYPESLNVDKQTAARALKLYSDIAHNLSLIFSQPYGPSGTVSSIDYSVLFKDVPFADIRKALDELEQIYKEAVND